MAFDEQNVNRESNGEFGKKIGWPPEVNLSSDPGLNGVSPARVAVELSKMDSGDRRLDAVRTLTNMPGTPLDAGFTGTDADELRRELDAQGIYGKIRGTRPHPTDSDLDVHELVLSRSGFYGSNTTRFTVTTPKGSQPTTSHAIHQALARNPELPEYDALNETAFALLYSGDEAGEERSLRDAHTYDEFQNGTPVRRPAAELAPGATIDFGFEEPGTITRVESVGDSSKVYAHDGRSLTFMNNPPVITY